MTLHQIQLRSTSLLSSSQLQSSQSIHPLQSHNPSLIDRQFWFRGNMPSFICPLQTCAKTYTTENRLQKHYQKKHDIRLPDDATTTSVVASKNGVKRKECGDEVRRKKK